MFHRIVSRDIGQEFSLTVYSIDALKIPHDSFIHFCFSARYIELVSKGQDCVLLDNGITIKYCKLLNFKRAKEDTLI